ncbi:hypothetical protein ACCUM_1361 [Candidatus Accumulibacter phosphatis]|uniref:Uncharacterized protein n=1 Tax=Candidatus Accumulibacter phosphatis TaxID=327160 RepID=A0A5S4EJA2_9PROT|nr:hypothetical protein [Accumulibacter sp.]EXI92383.1 MAG: hypothetical protein AW12_00594 [Candidatus Accumulibacter sp. BA-94]TMQ75379.1 hypothetical protein ACCUM_1361 [Candidatus Accumulibacter phosphatis]HMW57804.1 hypothetical protein [Accumulibacter sp.]
MDDHTETYCRMDDFYKAFEPGFNARLLSDGRCLGRGQAACLCRS